METALWIQRIKDTAARKRAVSFISLACLLVLGACAPQEDQYLQDVEDLNGQAVGVVIGSSHEIFVNAHYPQWALSHLESFPDLVLSLATGQNKAIVVDNITLNQQQEVQPGIQSFGPVLLKEEYGLVFSDPAMRDRFNVFLRKLKETGEYDRIVEIWMNGPDALRKIPHKNVSAPKGDLYAGAAISPFWYFVKDNEPQGFECHLLTLFCEEEGYRLVSRFMNFSSVLMAMTTHTVDVLGGGITITEERKQKAHFSNPTMQSEAYAVTMKTHLPPRLRQEEIAVCVGSSQDSTASQAYPNAYIRRYETEDEVLNALRNGFAEKALLSHEAAAAMQVRAPELLELSPGVYALASVQQEKKGFWGKLADSFRNNLVKEKRYVLILQGMWATVRIAVYSLLLGTLLGALVCFLRMRRTPWVARLARWFIAFMQGIPQVVLLMLMFYVVFSNTGWSGVTVSVITFALYFSAYAAEIFRTSIMGIDKGQTEAGWSLGFGKVKTFFYFILPQALRRVFPLYKAETVSLVKMTSVVGYIAVQDLTKASDIIRSRTFDAFFPLIFISVLYFVLAWLLAKCVEWGQNALVRQRL